MRRQLALSRAEVAGFLERIDVEGWDGPTGVVLLQYVRENLVGVQVRAAGLAGPPGAQAEASGWETAWQLLCSPAIRTARFPWSALRSAVRREVRGEWLAGRYLTDQREARELRGTRRAAACAQTPLSWDQLVGAREEPAIEYDDRPVQTVLTAVVGLLTDVGWGPELAARVVVSLAERARPTREKETPGWRQVAADLDLPHWQVRRIAGLLYAVAARSSAPEPGSDQSRQLPDLDCPELRGRAYATMNRWSAVVGDAGAALAS